jgi:5-oxoprolinase (ATP-hydrolysing)
LVDAEGRFLRENLARQLAESRSLSEVLGDLEAQVAANLVGARALSEWFEGVSEEQVAAWAEILLETARNSVRENVLKGLVSATAEDKLEDGTLLRLSLHVENDRLVVDFAGTEPAPGSNLHAPRAVVVASVLYALRCVVGGRLPLNEGVLDCVELRIPDGCVLAPIAPAAVCGGNVETSQRLADLMLRALGAQACGQGTMNNLTLGGADWSYYETIGGGSGAGPGFAGLSGRQVHMTNTRITDVEVLESRVPVRLCGFTLRSGSGGSGRWPGGAGLVRSFEALAPMQVAILAGRRRAGAPGLSGGTDGRVGAEERWQAGGWVPAARVFTAEVGDRFRVCTPGGGGWGEVED